MGLKLRRWQGCVHFEGSRGESVPCLFHHVEAICSQDSWPSSSSGIALIPISVVTVPSLILNPLLLSLIKTLVELELWLSR